MMMVTVLLLMAVVRTDVAGRTGRTGGAEIRKQHTEGKIPTSAPHGCGNSTRSLRILVRLLMRHRLRVRVRVRERMRVRLCFLFLQVTMTCRREHHTLLGRV